MDTELESVLEQRFGEKITVSENTPNIQSLTMFAKRRVHRHYEEREVDDSMIRLLCACSLSSPSKSDLQQADIFIVRDARIRSSLCELLPDQTWMKTAPVFILFLANGRRLLEISKMRGKPFPNDHLDALFNCSVDAGILLSNFMVAAETVGLGCCPISVIRDHAQAVSDLLKLPPRVFPIAGMCVGWPSNQGGITPRLPLALTIQTDTYNDENLQEHIAAFDRRREATHPLAQRDPDKWGISEQYGWSEDKSRQFGVPQCSDFGIFIEKIGFKLE